MEEVLRRTSLAPLAFPCFVLCFAMGGNRRAFRPPVSTRGRRGSCPLYSGTFAWSYRESTNPRFRIPRFSFGVIFLYLRQKTPKQTPPPLKKEGLVDSRESTNPRFRNPRFFVWGVFFLYLQAKKRQKPQTKPPPPP